MAVCSTEFGNLSQTEKDLQDARQKRLLVLADAEKRNGIVSDFQKNNPTMKDGVEYLSSLLRGSNKFGRDSVESSWLSKREQLSSVTDNQLYKGGYQKLAQKGLLDKDIADAWFKISNGEDPGTGPAADMARIYSQMADHVRDMQNAAGANIGDAKNYVTRTEWSAEKMRASAGTNTTLDQAFESWWSKDRPRMSDATFDKMPPPRPGQTIAEAEKEWGRDMFDAFLTGVHEKAGLSETGYIPKEYEGTANIDRRVSAHRAIVWKDGQSWHDHMQDFGKSDTLYQSLMNTIDRGTKSAALLDKLGSNPAAQLNLIIRRLQEEYRGDADNLNNFQSRVHYTLNEMKQLDGTAHVPANMGLHNFTSGVLAAENVSKLGGVGITHLVSVIPTATAELAQHGINRLSAMKELAEGLFQGRSSQELRDLQSQLGAYGDAAQRAAYDQIGAQHSGVAGTLSSWATKVVDMSGLNLVMDRSRSAIKGMLANNLAENLTKSFDQLDPHLQNMLQKYRIGPDEWEIMRGIDKIHTYNGRNYLTPASVTEGLGENVDPTIKNDIADNLLSYYSDAARHGTITPGIREQALLNFGTQRGTWANTFARFLTQFKAWPLALYHQALERDIYMSLSGREAAFNIGTMVAMGVPLGYLRSSIMNMAAGRPADDPSKPITWMNAAKESGMLGLQGDMLLGQTYKMSGQSPLVSLMGPVASDLDKLNQIKSNAMQDALGNSHHKNGKFGDIWPELARFGVNHLPFANLVYLKGALDYMAWYHVYEAASPGWWERTNKRLEKEQGRTMAGYTPGGPVPYGIPGVYLTGQDKGKNE